MVLPDMASLPVSVRQQRVFVDYLHPGNMDIMTSREKIYQHQNAFILPKKWQYKHVTVQLLKLNNNMNVMQENNILYIDTTGYYEGKGDS